MTTHYETLKVAPDAPQTVITASYRALMRANHPDIAGPAGIEATGLINHAYAVLSDEAGRRAYDVTLAPPSRPAPVRPPAPERPAKPAARRIAPQVFVVHEARKLFWVAAGGFALALVLVALVAVVAPADQKLTAGVLSFGIVAAGAIAIFRGWKGRTIAFILATFPPFYLGFTWAGLLAGLTFAVVGIATLAAAVLLDRTKEVVEATSWQRLIETVHAEDSAEVYFVVRADQADGRAHVLLERIESTEQIARTVWGTPRPGSYIGLSADNIVIGSAPNNAPVSWERLSSQVR